MQAADTQTDIALAGLPACLRARCAYQVWVIGREMGKKWKESSARRAVTVLKTRGFILKTDEVIPGPYDHGGTFTN